MNDALMTPVFEQLDSSVVSADELAFIDFIDRHLVGQPQAKLAARRIYRAIHNPFREPDRPIHSAILAGESRRGKNHLVRLLVRWFHGRDKAVVKINGGEFMERHNLARIIGAPHGYIGFEEGGNSRRRGEKDTAALLSQHNLDLSHQGSRYDVVFVLLDEWEKMHYSVINLLLAGLDEGEFTISNNTDVNFRNVVLLMTSNMGMVEVQEGMRRVGFFSERRKADAKDIGSAVAKSYRERTSPEFRNRIDSMVVFEPFVGDELLRIAQLEFESLAERVARVGAEQAFRLTAVKSAWALLLDMASKGEEDELANLKRLLTSEVAEPLSVMCASGSVRPGDDVEVSAGEGKFIFSRKGTGAVPIARPVVAEPAERRGREQSETPVTPARTARRIRIETVPDHLL